MPFQKGNKLGGRKKGSKHKATEIAQMLLDGQAQTITQKCIDMAIEGHPVALKLAMERLVPPRKIIEMDGNLSIHNIPDEKLESRIAQLLGKATVAVSPGGAGEAES
jgi:hypothetical protein